MSDSERDLTALHGPALLNGTFSRDTSMRDVLEMVTQFKDVEFGLFRILSKDLRGYFGVSFGKTIVGGHTTSTREFGVPALRELLGANRGMFIFAQLKEFPIEVRQSLEIPLGELLDWAPEGVPPNMVPSLPDALKKWEPAQAKLEQSECMDALRYGTLPASMDAAEDEASFMGYWGGAGQSDGEDDRTPAKPLSAFLPKSLSESGAMPKAPNPLAVTADMLKDAAAEAAKAPGTNGSGSGGAGGAGSNGDGGDAPQVKKEVAASWAPQGTPATTPPVQESRAVTPITPFPALTEDESDGAQIRPDVAASWAPAPQPALQQPIQQTPQVQGQMQQGDVPADIWSKAELDKIGRVDLPVTEEPKSGLGVSGRFKGGAASPPDGMPEELRVSQRVHRPDPELSASGKFIAAEIAAAGGFQVGSGPNFDPRSLMEAPPAKQPLDVVVVGCVVVALLFLGWAGFEIGSYLMSSGPSEVNAAANEIRIGNDDAADKRLRNVLKLNGANQAAKLTLAVSLIDRKKYDEAIALCDDILKKDAAEVDALRMRAVAHSHLEKYKEAIEDVDAYLKAAPDDDAIARSQALAIRAYADLKLGNLDDSIADYTKAIKLDEKNMHLFASRGIVRDMKKKAAEKGAK